MKVVSGIYHDVGEVTEAVRKLLGESVPADAIEVRVHRASGATETVAVQDESGVLEGAWAGARIGALLGALLMGGLAVVVPLTSGDGVMAGEPFSAALRGALGGAAAGVTLGGLIGIGRWKGLRDLDPEALEGGSVEVRVRSDDLLDTARRILEKTGAGEVSVSEGAGSGQQ